MCFVYGELEEDTFGWCTWDEFAAKANEVYDSGYGCECVDRELKVVGDDWWLERHEYDGSEWWEFKQKPTQTEKVDVRVWRRESW